MELSKDDTNTANVYYLTCPPSSSLNIGAPSSAVSNGTRVNVYGNGFTLTTAAMFVFGTGTRPQIQLLDNSTTRMGRVQMTTGSQVALTQNLAYTGSWNIDDTAKSGWGIRLVDSNEGDFIQMFRASAGSNPRTPALLFTFWASGALALAANLDPGVVAFSLPNTKAYSSENAATNAVLSLLSLDASDRTKLWCNSAVLAVDSPSLATTASAGAQTLPANPAGFWKVSLDGGTTTHKIPYYAN